MSQSSKDHHHNVLTDPDLCEKVTEELLVLKDQGDYFNLNIIVIIIEDSDTKDNDNDDTLLE